MLGPLRELQKQGFAEIQILNTEDSRPQLEWADLIFLQCLVGPEQLTFLEKVKLKKVSVVIDYDENLSELPKSLLKKFSDSEEKITNLWSKYLQIADLVTVPCLALKEKVQKYTLSRVEILPNLLTDFTYPSPTDLTSSTVKILLSCSSSHVDNLAWIGPSLKTIGEIFPNVEIVTVGDFNFTYYFPTYKGKAKHYPSVPFSSYQEQLRKIDPDIFLAPIKDTEYDRCRSDFKFWQAAAVKAAFLGSNIPPYSRTVVHNKTGLLAGNKLMFLYQLVRLIRDPALTKKIGKAALASITAGIPKTLEANIGLWKNAFSDLCKK